MSRSTKIKAIVFAILASSFYAISTPFSKLLLEEVSPTFMASFLYLGAGLGVGIMYLFYYKKESKEERINKNDFPYVISMILLDVLAPILLMIGINLGSASNASLLENFEIVATSLVALLIFKEKISWKLWIAIGIICLSCIVLSYESVDSFSFSVGSLFVILATCCWGIENNCTRKISNKSSYQIVVLKGVFSGGISLIISFVLNESIPDFKYIILTMLLGFISYGLSIFLYVKSQRDLGASKTSAFYSVTPFIGAFLSFVILNENLKSTFYIGLALMIAGTVFVVLDILKQEKI